MKKKEEMRIKLQPESYLKYITVDEKNYCVSKINWQIMFEMWRYDKEWSIK